MIAWFSAGTEHFYYDRYDTWFSNSLFFELASANDGQVFWICFAVNSPVSYTLYGSKDELTIRLGQIKLLIWILMMLKEIFLMLRSYNTQKITLLQKLVEILITWDYSSSILTWIPQTPSEIPGLHHHLIDKNVIVLCWMTKIFSLEFLQYVQTCFDIWIIFQ